MAANYPVNYLGWDTETKLFTPTNKAPDPVCYQLAGTLDTLTDISEFLASQGWENYRECIFLPWFIGSQGVRYDNEGLGPHAMAGYVTKGWALLVKAEHALVLHTWALAQAQRTHHDSAPNPSPLRLVAHNAPFDWSVLCKAHPELVPFAFHAVSNKWSTDTAIREKLYCIATDNYTFDSRIGRARKADGAGFPLSELVEIHFGEDIAGDKVRLAKLISEDVPRAQWPWRYKYEDLTDVPLIEWPTEAVHYALGDPVHALRTAYVQGDALILPEGPVCQNGEYVDEFAQDSYDWCLTLVSCNGVTVDSEAVDVFGERVEREAFKCVEVATANGWRKVNKCRTCAPGGRPNCGTGWYGEVPDLVPCVACGGDPHFMPPRTRKPLDDKSRGNCKARLEAWVTYAYGGMPPRNEPTEKAKAKGILTGSIKTDFDTLFFSDEPILVEYSSGLAAEKLRNTYLKFLRLAAVEGSLHGSFNVIVRSGRTSGFRPNMQNPPRLGGFRECFMAPLGLVFASLDFASQEMGTLAQVCLTLFGESAMAQAINAGLDTHLDFALRLLKTDGIDLTYEQASAELKKSKVLGREEYALALENRAHPLHIAAKVKYWRQVAKVCNFGYPGGLGSNTFVTYAKGYGLTLSPNESSEYRRAYFKQWPQVDRYLNKYLRGLSKGPEGQRFAIRQHFSGRIRGGCTFTSAANTFFQGLAADGTKQSLWGVVKEQYTNPLSPLWGTRTWNVVHDELLLVGPEETAHEWAYEAARIMVESMERLTPGVKHTVEPALMRRWYKNADTVLDASGRLIPWEPQAKEGT